MAFNYHKRLTAYLAQNVNEMRRAHSHTSFSQDENSKYYTTAKLKSKHSNGPYNLSNIGATRQNQHNHKTYKNRNYLHCTHQQQLYQNERNKQLSATQYFGTEIKAIKNTLVDIRDQMKNGGKFKSNEQSHFRKIKPQFQNGFLNQNTIVPNQKDPWQISYWQEKLQERDRVNKQYIQKIESLQQINLHLNQQISELKEDNSNWLNKTNMISPQIKILKQKLIKVQKEKNNAQERQRTLQIQIMDLRAKFIKCEQQLKDWIFKYQKEKQMKALKNMSMGIIEEFNVMINWKKDDQNRSSQTYLTDVDIQNGYRQINQLQDSLCEKINNNLKVQKRIFMRISQVDQKLRSAYDRLYRIQENALRIGIVEPI